MRPSPEGLNGACNGGRKERPLLSARALTLLPRACYMQWNEHRGDNHIVSFLCYKKRPGVKERAAAGKAMIAFSLLATTNHMGEAAEGGRPSRGTLPGHPNLFGGGKDLSERA